MIRHLIHDPKSRAIAHPRMRVVFTLWRDAKIPTGTDSRRGQIRKAEEYQKLRVTETS